MDADFNFAEVHELVDQIRPILAGRDPAIQSMVLADLLSTWLAGHLVAGDKKQTAKLREKLLAGHVKLVGEFLQPNEQLVLQRLREGPH